MVVSVRVPGAEQKEPTNPSITAAAGSIFRSSPSISLLSAVREMITFLFRQQVKINSIHPLASHQPSLIPFQRLPGHLSSLQSFNGE